MAIYCITYDLRSPGRNYTPVHEYLKQFNYCKGLESFWLVDTQKTASEIRDALKSRVDANDVIFVGKLQGNWASWNFGCGEWLNNAGRRW